MSEVAVKNTAAEAQHVLEALGLSARNSGVCGKAWVASPKGEVIASVNPATGEVLAEVVCATEEEYEAVIADTQEVFTRWRLLPAPKRGEIIRQIGEEFRAYKEPLGQLISLEVGKVLSEGLGEVQEAIDICDFAVGLSRQLYGFTMHSERPDHRMYEQWHPLGPVGIITAFNLPCSKSPTCPTATWR